MSDSDKNECLELYKLHSDLADRVSQRREGANRLYVSLLVGLVIFLAALLRFGIGEFPLSIVVLCAGLLGVFLSISWLIVLRSYQQLNSGKFMALHELETKLSFQFFQQEWQLLGEGKNTSKYWKLSVVEWFLPLIFLVSFLVLIFVSCFV